MIASESRGAWKEIERRLRPYVARRVTSDSDVDDILQEVFIRMQRSMADLRDGERFGGWVYRIAQNVIIDAARARGRDPVLPATFMPVDVQIEAAEAEEALKAGLGACVVVFVARLPSPYREAITLTELEGLTHNEAAALLGISLSGMKSRVQRGRERLRSMFEACCEISTDCRGRVVECEPRQKGGESCPAVASLEGRSRD